MVNPARRGVSVYADGAALGNPGPAGIGVRFEGDAERLPPDISRPIGKATNNVAEYRALVCALEAVRDCELEPARVYLDSQLVVRQVLGEYKVKDKALQPLHRRAHQLLGDMERVAVIWVSRDKNKEANRLAVRAARAQRRAARPKPERPTAK